jgi:Protein of unknown function (DUF2795)
VRPPSRRGGFSRSPIGYLTTMIDAQQAAELQVLLEGIALPAGKQELLDYASRQSEPGPFLAELRSLPEREYRTIDEVGEELLPTQPRAHEEAMASPRDESGQPPGGDEYTNPDPDSGAVRPDWPENNPPDKVVQQQSEQQKTQKERQEGKG